MRQKDRRVWPLRQALNLAARLRVTATIRRFETRLREAAAVLMATTQGPRSAERNQRAMMPRATVADWAVPQVLAEQRQTAPGRWRAERCLGQAEALEE